MSGREKKNKNESQKDLKKGGNKGRVVAGKAREAPKAGRATERRAIKERQKSE